jgi:reactive chlorine resistance protein C
MQTQAQAVKNISEIGTSLKQLSEFGVRYAMVVVVAWYGLLKFTEYEANAIAGFAMNSPFLAPFHEALGIRGFSNIIGIIEIIAAVLIAVHHFSPKAGALGGLFASGTFIVTLSFMFTTPGIFEASAGGFPILSVVPGAFLLKDLVLLAVSVWLLATSLQQIKN